MSAPAVGKCGRDRDLVLDRQFSGSRQFGEFNSPDTSDCRTQMFDIRSFALYDDYLQAVIMIQMNMSGADRIHIVTVLCIHYTTKQIAVMMVKRYSQNADDFLGVHIPFFLHDSFPNEISNKF